MRIPITRTTMSSLLIGIVVGSLMTLLVSGLVLRLLTHEPAAVTPVSEAEAPGITITVPRDTLQYLINDALAGVEIPLVTVHDADLQLEPDALVVLYLHGDTALLGDQTVVLRTRIIPVDGRLSVATESADIAGWVNVTGSLTQQLDNQINAVLVEQLQLDERLEIVGVGGTTDEVLIEAHLREQSQEE